MTEDDLAEIVRAVSLSEEEVEDLRIVVDEKAGLLAVGLYASAKQGPAVLLLHLAPGQRPIRMRIQGAHRVALSQMLGLALDAEEE